MATTETKRESKRVSFDLSPAVSAELEKMQRITDLSKAELFRHALTLLRVYLRAQMDRKSVLVVDENDSSDRVRIEMPIPIHFAEDENL